MTVRCPRRDCSGFLSDDGTVPVVACPFVPKDHVYLLTPDRVHDERPEFACPLMSVEQPAE